MLPAVQLVPEDGAPIHLERGFLRPGEPGRVEFTLAHPIGLTEVAEGALDGTSFALSSTDVGRTTDRAETTTSAIRRYDAWTATRRATGPTWPTD